MTDKQFKDLEKLLSKLGVHLGHTYCIIPNYLQDGCSIGIYDNHGDLAASEISHDLKSTVEKLTNKTK